MEGEEARTLPEESREEARWLPGVGSPFGEEPICHDTED